MMYSLNQPQIDWITITRTGRLGEDGLAGNLLAYTGTNQDVYSGLRLVTLVYVPGVSEYIGRQVNTPHGQLGIYEHRIDNSVMITMSSALAHITRGEWMTYIGTGDWKATRLDVQVTVAGKYDPVKLMGLLHGKRSVSLISSHNTRHDGDSVYIGSDKSDRFAVIYEKRKGEHVRLELRHKGPYAERVATTLALRNHSSHEDILEATLSNWARQLPSQEAVDAIVRKFDLGGHRTRMEYIVDAREGEKRAKWLLNVAWSSIRRCVLAGEYPASDLINNMMDLIDEVINGNKRQD